MQHREIVIFDFDGTLIDSDEALLAPMDLLGVSRSDVVMGSAVAQECERLGVSLDDYVAAYDTEVSRPFPGVAELLRELDRWAICSNKHPTSAGIELDRLGWKPELVMCADAFDWGHKSLVPMLEQMDLDAAQVLLVGDSGGDLRCAEEVACRFVWAGWNERVRANPPSGDVANTPQEVLEYLN